MDIPSATEVRQRLLTLNHAQLRRLEVLSGVPFPTLLKVRLGTTENPGIETVRKFVPHIEEAGRADAQPTPAAA